MKKIILIGIAFTSFALLIGCADMTNVQDCIPAGEHTYGFWGGVWHGMIAQFDFLGSLIWDDVAVYAVNNNGAWYNFGFVGGLGFFLKIIDYAIKGITLKE